MLDALTIPTSRGSGPEAKAIDSFLRSFPSTPPSEDIFPDISLDDQYLASVVRNRQQRRARTIYQRIDVDIGQPLSLSERVANRLRELKIQTSQVSMHLPRAWHLDLLKQLDFLLFDNEWPEDTGIPSQSSYQTLLNVLLELAPTKLPSLGVNDAGKIMAAWVNDSAKLYLTCHEVGQITWSASQRISGKAEAIAGTTTIDRLTKHLTGFDVKQWFRYG